MQKGYRVETLDYSRELVALASQQMGLQLRFESFYDLSDQSQFDGIWACASLLHCYRHRFAEVLEKMLQALKSYGVM